MNIVETKQYGDTVVRFCDDCCKEVSEQEIKKIFREITNKTLPYLRERSA